MKKRQVKGITINYKEDKSQRRTRKELYVCEVSNDTTIIMAGTIQNQILFSTRLYADRPYTDIHIVLHSLLAVISFTIYWPGDKQTEQWIINYYNLVSADCNSDAEVILQFIKLIILRCNI